MASQIPALLESYLSLPPETSQIVLTGILGASTNWLVLRSLYSLLKPAAAAGRTPLPTQRDGATPTGTGEEDEDVKVLLNVHATVITLAADDPLLSAQTTALEKEHAALVLSLAHEAEAVLSLRLLDTGTAKDVGGVVRITRGGGSLDTAIEEHEYLYHVGGDGGVKVFERGQ
ncbi:hypothetical protein VM1G_08173 [Cytospora mali]|uniref:Uncharacterized protein n=1 Tax=Cytospora mali TaxID=578113 RepID=A0A194W970_CYTMA|nr:hypothetical protein VM1G_08173 [Valsa mali]